MLVVPSGWWVASRSLENGLVLRRAFPTSEERARLLQGVKGGLTRNAMDEPSWAGTTEACDDPDADIFERSSGYRARGNTEFGRGRYREACEAYTRAIGLLCGGDDFCFDEQPSQGRDDLAVLYSNRAACRLKLGRYSEAVEDCNEVLRSGRCDAIAVKALFRRGKAHEGLGDVKPAYRDFRQVVELEPNNVAALVEIENYRSVLHRLIVKQRGTPENREKKEAEFQEKWRTMKEGKNRPLDADEADFLEGLEVAERVRRRQAAAEEEEGLLAFQLAQAEASLREPAAATAAPGPAPGPAPAPAPRPAAPRGAKRPARGPQGALRVRVAKKPKQTEGAEAGDAGGGLLGLGGYGESGSES